MNKIIFPIKVNLPIYVIKVAYNLIKNGYDAYLAGGPVRDILQGKKPDDFDIATNADPSVMLNIFPKSVATGLKYGTITVLEQDDQDETRHVHVTTFREEQAYVGGRWPSIVEFSKSIKQDVKRRDFTINALAIDLKLFISRKNSIGIERKDVLDLFGGIDDLEKGIVRAVGDPKERLFEDGLRALRACRFCSTLGFYLDPNLKKAIKSSLNIVKKISIERVREEFEKLILNSPKPSVGLRLMKETELLELFIPELLEGIGVEQPNYHVDDVFDHILKTVDVAEDSVKYAALFHDIAKPHTYKEGHFYGHDLIGYEMTKEIMKRLKFSNKEIEHTATLVRWHMFYYPFKKGRDDEGMDDVKHIWSDSAIRRFVKNIGGVHNLNDLFKLRIADATANPKSTFNPTEIQILEKRVSEVIKKDLALRVTDLDISGFDLINIGVSPGPDMGNILQYLLEEVVENPKLNKKSTLIKMVRDYLDIKKGKKKK